MGQYYQMGTTWTQAEGSSDKWIKESGKSATGTATEVHLFPSRAGRGKRILLSPTISVPTVRACPFHSPAMSMLGKCAGSQARQPGSSGHGSFHPRNKGLRLALSVLLGQAASPGPQNLPARLNSHIFHFTLHSHTRPSRLPSFYGFCRGQRKQNQITRFDTWLSFSTSSSSLLTIFSLNSAFFFLPFFLIPFTAALPVLHQTGLGREPLVNDSAVRRCRQAIVTVGFHWSRPTLSPSIWTLRDEGRYNCSELVHPASTTVCECCLPRDGLSPTLPKCQHLTEWFSPRPSFR